MSGLKDGHCLLIENDIESLAMEYDEYFEISAVEYDSLIENMDKAVFLKSNALCVGRITK